MPSKVLDFKTPLQALLGYTVVPAILMLPPRVFGVSEIHVELRQLEHISLATEHHEDDHEAHVTSPSAVPENPTLENDPEVSSFNNNILAPPIGYVLPNRHNRGKPPSRYSLEIEGRRLRYPIANYVSTKKLNEPLKTFVHNIFGCHVPTRVEEALGDQKWTQAIKDEMEALMKNKIWNLVPIPEGKKIVGLEEEVYMDIPPGYSVTMGTNEVCKLQQALYGLKQSPRAWFGQFSLAMKKYGFQQSNANHTLFLKKQQGKVTTLIVYVDDMVITGDDIEEISWLQGEEHMEAVIRILRYLKSSLGKGLMFSKNDHVRVDGYTYADWVGNISDRKSTSGYFTFVGGNLVTWRSKKQKVVALSSAEVEFRGMAKGLCELLWLKRLLTEIGFAPKSEMNLFCDNKAAIDISHNRVQHDRTKHVEVDRHFIKYNLETNTIRFPFVKI
ncbi:Retrovirus-related Pol polyprotein from transposon TNT 1-94 [Vitis vinifera]|uniref:Retrovirus-related Pol polyprotein from transposon TNT 1-94 n=1 Tax=Vitis vinifera TaxID=29760 RepID=A0A438G7X3_VITVI|nr:Retrovirus-related Pol polyprotein from transposon TNT 1-94 [Vitis vinifera]